MSYKSMEWPNCFSNHYLLLEMQVCAAVGLADLLSTFFAILSFRIYVTTTCHLVKGKGASLGRSYRTLNNFFILIKDTAIKLLVVLLLAGIAMLFKEQGLTVLVCPVFSYFEVRSVKKKLNLFKNHQGICCAYEYIYWFNFGRTGKQELSINRMFKSITITVGCAILL